LEIREQANYVEKDDREEARRQLPT
jgi:hypothetical protein